MKTQSIQHDLSLTSRAFILASSFESSSCKAARRGEQNIRSKPWRKFKTTQSRLHRSIE